MLTTARQNSGLSLNEIAFWLGAGSIPWDDQSMVATRAALVATKILPSVPGYMSINQKSFTFLHDTPSIPAKAHQLAGETLQVVLAEQPFPVLAYLKLCERINPLVAKVVATTARLFCAFRRAHQQLLCGMQEESAADHQGQSRHLEALCLNERLIINRRMLKTRGILT